MCVRMYYSCNKCQTVNISLQNADHLSGDFGDSLLLREISFDLQKGLAPAERPKFRILHNRIFRFSCELLPEEFIIPNVPVLQYCASSDLVSERGMVNDSAYLHIA